jgi:hypothetical protein
MTRRLPVVLVALALAVVPMAGEAAAKVTPPAGTPNLAGAALRLSDMPRGVRIERQEYVAPSNAVATYEREFDTIGAYGPIGGSQLINLETDVELNKNALIVSSALGVLASLPQKALQRLFASSTGGAAGGGALRVIRVSRFAVRLGDQAVAIRGSFSTPLGRADAVFLYFRVGRIANQLYAVGPAGRVSSAGIVNLARKMVPRTRAVLAAR